jgi:hypothetical protein
MIQIRSPDKAAVNNKLCAGHFILMMHMNVLPTCRHWLVHDVFERVAAHLNGLTLKSRVLLTMTAA